MTETSTPWDDLERCMKSDIPGKDAGRLVTLLRVHGETTLTSDEVAELLDLQRAYALELAAAGLAS